MADKLGQNELNQALAALGERRHSRTEIVLGGAGALILTGDLQRATSDCDVLYSDPDIGRLQDDIRAVAHRLGLTSGWLNGSVQSYLDILPPDYRSRLRSLPMPGSLHVFVLHRQDVIVMKLFAGRSLDLEDIAALAPTTEELVFARTQLPRLRLIDAPRATRTEGFLNELHNQKS